MPVVYVTSDTPRSGRTGVAAAIARHFAYLGVPVTLARIADESATAGQDADYFSTLDFAPDSPVEPIAPAAVGDPGAVPLLVVEGSKDAAPEGARVVFVARANVPVDIGGAAAVVVTGVAPGTADTADTGETPLFIVPEDRCLAGFSVADIPRTLPVETLVEGELPTETCDHLVIAPIGSDAGQPYFLRFERKAVVVRYDKTDMQLAALRGDSLCLVLTGGRRPSEYLFDAAGAQGVPVFLSRTDTENTVMALEELFEDTRFEGAAKLDRMSELLDESGLFEALGIEVPA